MKTIKNLTIAFIATLTLFSCSKDDNPAPVNEEEVITTLKVTLVNGNNTVVLQSKDSDGDGPIAPVVTVVGDLTANTTYDGSIELLNETESPAEDVTEEVKEEAKEHQFFYAATNGVATFAYDDKDADNNPIGIKFKMTTANEAKTGKVTFTLRHEPNKNADGVSGGDIANAGGETDIEVTFDVEVVDPR